MQNYVEVAAAAAKKAGELQRRQLGGDVTVSRKGAIDLVTDVDRESERIIVGAIRAAFPDHNILAEEGEYDATASPCRWIIDPLDGTTNYAHGFPWFAVSIALEVAGVVQAGVVYHTMLDELYTAVRGEGAFVNGRPLRVSTNGVMRDALLATGFPYDRTMENENNIDLFVAFTMASRGVRRAGAAALDLACVAAGRLDGFWECKLKPWDVAAGMLLVQEAGGQVTGYDGEPYGIHEHRIVASNGVIHPQMLAVIAGPDTSRFRR
jgi:myo-inositol-1(or 4)-monophosphatase